MINIQLMKDSLGFVLSGLPYTLGISLLSFLTGLVFGLLLALLGRSRQPLLHYLVRAYISIMRGCADDRGALCSLFRVALLWFRITSLTLRLPWFFYGQRCLHF
ncbi:cystine transport system permease [Streptococcus dysgalactiae subsp. equisimilis 167]|nr:cystine transport system permease [Streptococcus dysgalactiae subsp. equisimilis 167]